ERIAGGLRVRSKAAGSGVDEVREVEQLAFDDRTIYLDGSNNAVVSRPDTGFSVKYGQTLRIPIQKLLENDWDFDGDKLSITKVKRARIVGSDIVYASPQGIQWSSVQGDSIQHTFF